MKLKLSSWTALLHDKRLNVYPRYTRESLETVIIYVFDVGLYESQDKLLLFTLIQIVLTRKHLNLLWTMREFNLKPTYYGLRMNERSSDPKKKVFKQISTSPLVSERLSLYISLDYRGKIRPFSWNLNSIWSEPYRESHHLLGTKIFMRHLQNLRNRHGTSYFW